MTMENEAPHPHEHGTGGAEDEAPFDDFDSGGGGGFGELIQNNPMIKAGLILAVFAAIVIALVLFGGKKKVGPVSVVKGAGSTVSQTPGTSDQVSDVYKKAMQDTNQQAVENALKSHGSAIPEPIATPQGRVPVAEGQQNAEDPLTRWRKIQEERAHHEAPAHTNLPQANPNAAAIKDLANAMSTQMSSVLNSIKPEHAQHEDVDKPEKPNAATGAGTKANGTTTNASGGTVNNTNGTSGQPTVPVEIIVPAGTISYAQLITTADSDTKGPVLAEIMGGPLAGDRILGTFDLQDEYLVLKFNNVIIDGIGHPTDGVALDPATDTEGLATDVDHRYFDRIILPGAAAFIEGLGSAIAATGSTVSQTDSSTISSTPPLDVKQQIFAGISAASQQAAQVLTQDGNKRQLRVTVAAGTPIGILFTQPVTDQTK